MQGYLAIGQAWGDYDRDGWIDLFVTGNLEPNILYRNLGDGGFAVSALSDQLSLPDLPSGGATFADYNNDGWLDLYILNFGANRLFRNDAGAGFTDVTLEAGVGDRGKGTSAAWGDYDGDGWLDLYLTNWSCYPECDPVDFAAQQDRLYHNNGDGSFTDVTLTLEYGLTWGPVSRPLSSITMTMATRISTSSTTRCRTISAMCSGATMAPAAPTGAGRKPPAKAGAA